MASDKLEVTIIGKDELSNVMRSVQNSMEGMADVAKGALTVSLGAATAAVAVLGTTLAISLKEAMDAEMNMAQLDAALKAVGATATQAADEWAAAQGQFVESTKLSADEVEKLKQKSSDLEFEIRKQEDALSKAASAKKVDAIAVEEHQRAIKKLKSAFAETNQEIADGTKVIKTDLATALGLAQPAAMMTKEELVKLSMSLRDLAGGSDDAVLGVETVLLRMGVAKDVFPQATKAILDASAALGKDLQTTAQMVGKTLVAPGEGLAKLKAIGATFTDSQEKVIKSLVATGKTAEAQKFILDALAKTTEGAAEAKAKTFGGQLEILRGHMLEVAEGVGAQLLPILSNLSKQVLPVLEKLVGQIGENFGYLVPLFLRLAESGGKLASEILRLAGIDLSESSLESFVAIATGTLANLTTEATKFTEWLTANLAPALASAQTQFAPLVAAFQNFGASITEKMPAVIANLNILKERLVETFKVIGPELIGNLSGIINKLAEIWSKHGDTIMAIVRIAFGGVFATIAGALMLVTSAVESFLIWISGLFDAFSLLLQGNWKGAWDALVLAFSLAALNLLSGFETFFNMVVSLLGTNMETVRATWSTNWENVKLIVTTIWTNIRKAIAESIVNVMNTLDQFVTDAINFFKRQYQTFYNMGQDFIEGLRKGIEDKFNHILKGLRDMAGAMVDVVKDVLSINSPSDVMRDIGANMMQGLQQGIADNMTLRVNRFDVQDRDSGGRGIAGQPYLIGRGAQPELFVPDSSGTFKPNAGGRGGVINVYFTYAPAVSLGDRYEAEQTLIPLIQQALRQS